MNLWRLVPRKMSLRTLLLLTVAFAIYFSVVVPPLLRNRDAVQAIVYKHHAGFCPTYECHDSLLAQLVPDGRYTLRMQRLTFDNRQFDDSALKDIARYREYLTTLTDLSLTGTSVTDNGVLILSDFPNVERLYLSQLDITDRSLGLFYKLKKLTYLDVRGTKISSNYIRTLRSSFPKCVIIADRPTPSGARGFTPAARFPYSQE